MGFISGLFKRILKLVFYLVILGAFIIFIPNLPPYTKFTRIEIEPSQPRVGALAPNTVLNNAEKLYENKLLGPEAFQIWNGEVYTGLATGEIVKISPGGHVTFVTKIGEPCSLIQEHICGRPLGFVIDEKNKLLYVADAYHGIWMVNLITNKKQLLVSPRVAIDGRFPKIFNSVALDNNGNLYWTDSSSDFHLRDGVLVVLADPTGRLFHYSFAKNESKVLLDDLWFANGLIVSPDNNFILVAESSKYRLIKYYINGPKKRTSEVFVAGLPGVPDNIRTLPDGSGVLLSLYSVFDDEHPLLVKTASTVPLARKFLARVLRLIEIPFEFLHSQFPNHIFENIVHMIGSFGSVASLAPGMSGLVQIDWNGNIIASYYNTDGSLHHISDVVVFDNKLYIGCPHLQNFIGAVPAPPQLIKAFTTPALPKIKPTTETTTKPTKPSIEKKVVLETVKSTMPTPPKTTTTQTPSQKQSTTQSNDNKKENVKQNKPDEIKPKVATKEPEPNKPKENKPNTVTNKEHKVEVKNVNETPKTVPKEADIKLKAVPKDTKANVAPKETDAKNKVTPKQTEQKPKLEQKQADQKIEVDKVSTKSKIQEPQGEPVIKDKEEGAKVSKEEVKEKTENKVNKDTIPKQSDTKTTTKAPEIKNKNKKKADSAEPKPIKADNESLKKAPKTITKPTPIEEEIPSDTAKPSKETLKVIKKSGPQEIPLPKV